MPVSGRILNHHDFAPNAVAMHPLNVIFTLYISKKHGLLLCKQYMRVPLIPIQSELTQVFINNGEQVITDLVFPTMENGSIEFFATKKSSPIKNIDIWRMDPALQ